MRLLITCVLLGTFAGRPDKAIDLGATDQKEPPAQKELKLPKAGDKTDAVGLNATVKGSVGKDAKKYVYVLVTPLSSPELKNTWWVQGEVTRKGDAYECEAQFGEGDAGAGEYFAIVGITTDREHAVGDQLKGIPAGATYTKLKIVKREK
jgi:hypothetical protein